MLYISNTPKKSKQYFYCFFIFYFLYIFIYLFLYLFFYQYFYWCAMAEKPRKSGDVIFEAQFTARLIFARQNKWYFWIPDMKLHKTNMLKITENLTWRQHSFRSNWEMNVTVEFYMIHKTCVKRHSCNTLIRWLSWPDLEPRLLLSIRLILMWWGVPEYKSTGSKHPTS